MKSNDRRTQNIWIHGCIWLQVSFTNCPTLPGFFFTIFNPAVFDGGGDRSRMQQVIPEHLAHGELPSSTRLPDDGSGMARSNG